MQECTKILARLVATSFAIACFVATIIIGVTVGNSASTILFSALGVLLVCWGIGWAAGAVAQRALTNEINRYKEQRPLPELEVSAVGAGSDQSGNAEGTSNKKETPDTPA